MDPLTLLSLGSAGLGLVGNIGGQIGAGSQHKKSSSFIDTQRAEAQKDINDNRKTYDRESNQDYFDTNVAQSAIKQMDKNAKKANEAQDNENIRGGATADQNIASRGRVQDAKQDAMTALGGQGTAYKQSVKSQFLAQDGALKSRLRGYDSHKVNLYNQRAKSWGNFGSNAGDLLSNGLSSFADGLGTTGKQQDDGEEE